MNYWKLFLPIPIAILLVSFGLSIERSYPEYSLSVGTIIKGGLLIYYLRLGNKGTPLINTLTIMLLLVLCGEYFIRERFTVALTLVVFGNLGFGLTFVYRQRLKKQRDKNSGLKAAAVFAYGLSMIFYLTLDIFAILMIGGWALAGVYFYDRLIQISERKNLRQQRR